MKRKDVANPLTAIAALHSTMAHSRMVFRRIRSTRLPMGRVNTAPTKETAEMSRPIAVFPTWNTASRLPATAEMVALSPVSSARMHARTRMTWNRAGPPAHCSTLRFASDAASWMACSASITTFLPREYRAFACARFAWRSRVGSRA
jgi:hypothetical protein